MLDELTLILVFVSTAFCNTYNRCRFSKGGLATCTVFCCWFRQEKKVDWAGTGCETGLNIVSYAHTCSIVWMSVIFFCNLAVLLVRQISNLAMLKWELWPGRHRARVWKPTCVLLFEKVSGVLRSGDLASGCGCTDSTERCQGPACALHGCGAEEFAGLPL